jgi:hypothetical protein
MTLLGYWPENADGIIESISAVLAVTYQGQIPFPFRPEAPRDAAISLGDPVADEILRALRKPAPPA